MDSYTIDVTRLGAAIRLVVRGFGSNDAEVEAVAGNLIEATSPVTIRMVSACCRATPMLINNTA